jgi:hypothetical protein
VSTQNGTFIIGNNGVATLTWATLTNGNVGQYMEVGRIPDKTVHVSGTFGSATLTWQGSNDGTNFYTLTDADGADLAFTAAGLALCREAPKYIRPSAAGGGGTTSLNCYVSGIVI